MPQVRMKNFDTIPDGLYPAIVDSVTEKEGKFGAMFSIAFRVSQDIGEVKSGSYVNGLVSQVLTPKSKLGRWLTAMGIVLDIDQNFELFEIKGKTVAIEVVVKRNFSNVVDVKSIQTITALQQANVTQPIQPVQNAALPTPQTQNPQVPQQVQQPQPSDGINNPGPNLGEDDILF